MVQSTAQQGQSAQTDDSQSGLRYKRNPRRDFVQVSWRVTRCPHLTDGAKVLYANLVSHDWGDNPCFPGIDTLASYQGVSRQQASAYLNELKAANLVRSRRRFGTTSVYEIESDEDAWRLDVNQRLRPVRDTVVNPGLHEEYADPNTQSSNTQSSKKGGASASRSGKSSAQKKTSRSSLDEETATAARTFLDAFCQMWPVARQADPGWWGEAVKAVREYPLVDLLALVAYKKSRGRVSEAIRPKHVAADIEGWVAVGRPAAAAPVRSTNGQRDSNVGMGSTSTERLGSQDVYTCLVCGRVEGSPHRTARGCPDSVVVRADCEVA